MLSEKEHRLYGILKHCVCFRETKTYNIGSLHGQCHHNNKKRGRGVGEVEVGPGGVIAQFYFSFLHLCLPNQLLGNGDGRGDFALLQENERCSLNKKTKKTAKIETAPYFFPFNVFPPPPQTIKQ